MKYLCYINNQLINNKMKKSGIQIVIFATENYEFFGMRENKFNWEAGDKIKSQDGKYNCVVIKSVDTEENYAVLKMRFLLEEVSKMDKKFKKLGNPSQREEFLKIRREFIISHINDIK